MDTPKKKRRNHTATGAGIAGIIAAFFIKFKLAILAAFKALPLLKFGWLLKGSWTMLLSLGLYSMMFGWRYAAILIALIYIHEMGHYIYMKFKGLNPKAPVFVPFLGAYVAMTNLPRDPVTHAWVAYAGPFLGGITALGLFVLGAQTGNHYVIAAASTGLMLNLLQLVPIRPFDGGFIAECISKWLAIPGIVLLLLIAFCWHSILLIVIGATAGISAISRLKSGSTLYGDQPVSGLDRLQVTVAYFGLAWFLAYYFWRSEIALHSVIGH